MIHRANAGLLVEMLTVFPVVALVGPRQVGKSTLVTGESMFSSRLYRTFDGLADRSLAQSDPIAFLDVQGPMTIDEVQLVPSLLRELKRTVDSDRTTGRFLITGSADLNYAADLSHVLAGRVGIVELPPITHFERDSGHAGEQPCWIRFALGGPDTLDLHPCGTHATDRFQWRELTVGGFPLSITAASERARRLWFESFRLTYLERDLRRILDVGNLAAFARLMELSAARTGGILNVASMARDCGIPVPTAGR